MMAEEEFQALRLALLSCVTTMNLDSRDWSMRRRDAWFYGILVGWDEALPEIADRYDWSATTVAQLREMNAAVRRVTGLPMVIDEESAP